MNELQLPATITNTVLIAGTVVLDVPIPAATVGVAGATVSIQFLECLNIVLLLASFPVATTARALIYFFFLAMGPGARRGKVIALRPPPNDLSNRPEYKNAPLE